MTKHPHFFIRAAHWDALALAVERAVDDEAPKSVVAFARDTVIACRAKANELEAIAIELRDNFEGKS